jgi:hypothetical protein
MASPEASKTKLKKTKAGVTERYEDAWCILRKDGSLDVWTVSSTRIDSMKLLIRKSGGTFRGEVADAEVEQVIADHFEGNIAVQVRIAQLLN